MLCHISKSFNFDPKMRPKMGHNSKTGPKKGPKMGATWDPRASKPAPGALRDPSSTAKDPSRAAKRLSKASRDPPGIDFDPSRDRLGAHFDPPGGPGHLKNCSHAMLQVTAGTAAIAFQNSWVGGCSR